MSHTLVIITGPTAVGKTEVAIKLAKMLETEIISCDSRQMYRELSIGTAVPTASQLKEVKHHFIHNISIHDYYNAYIFEEQSLKVLDELFKKHKVIIMTGGSGLYIDALMYGIDDLPTIDLELRDKLTVRLSEEGIESLRNELRICDPEYYQIVDLKNPKRILKALEIYYMTGKPYSSLLTREKRKRNFNIILIGLNIDRQVLHERINFRVDEMLKEGLIAEARKYYPHKHLNSLNTVGYKELFDHFNGKSSLEEAIELIKRDTRRYARRQLTWLRRYSNLKWFSLEQVDEIKEYILLNINS